MELETFLYLWNWRVCIPFRILMLYTVAFSSNAGPLQGLAMAIQSWALSPNNSFWGRISCQRLSTNLPVISHHPLPFRSPWRCVSAGCPYSSCPHLPLWPWIWWSLTTCLGKKSLLFCCSLNPIGRVLWRFYPVIFFKMRWFQDTQSGFAVEVGCSCFNPRSMHWWLTRLP